MLGKIGIANIYTLYRYEVSQSFGCHGYWTTPSLTFLTQLLMSLSTPAAAI